MMKKFTLIIKLTAIIFISHISIQESRGQKDIDWFYKCQQPLNLSDSLELAKIFGKLENEFNDDWFYFGFVDTLGECRVSAIGGSNFNIYAETDTLKFEITNFPLLEYIEFSYIGFNELILSNLPSLQNIALYSMWVNKNIILNDHSDLKKIYAQDLSSVGWILNNLPNIDTIDIKSSNLGDISDFIHLPNLKSLTLKGSTFDQDLTYFENSLNVQ